MLSLWLIFIAVVSFCLVTAYRWDVKEIEKELIAQNSYLFNLSSHAFAKHVYWNRLENDWWMFKTEFKYALKARIPEVKGYWNIVTLDYWNLIPYVSVVVERLNGNWSLGIEVHVWNRWSAIELRWFNWARYAHPKQIPTAAFDKEQIPPTPFDKEQIPPTPFDKGEGFERSFLQSQSHKK